MLRYFKKVGRSFFDLIYPPLCLHCKVSLEHDNPILCNACLALMVPIDPSERCPYCFSHVFCSASEKCCLKCLESPLLLDRIGAVFDYDGPAANLVKQLKYGGQIHLAKGAGAYLAAQFVALEWPMPDVVVPMPAARLKRLERGYNQSLLLAEAFGKIINRPVADVMHRHSGDFSQAGLDFEERMKLDSAAFSVRPNVKLHGKTVLLIDDVMTTGTTLKCCADALRAAFPKAIFALTVCRAI